MASTLHHDTATQDTPSLPKPKATHMEPASSQQGLILQKHGLSTFAKKILASSHTSPMCTQNLPLTAIKDNLSSSHEGLALKQVEVIVDIDAEAFSSVAIQGSQEELWSGGAKGYQASEQYQLRNWVYETSSSSLTLAEKLEKAKWEGCGSGL